LKVKHQVDYATNAYFVEAPEGTGQKVFEIAADMLKRSDVEYCHPELIRARARKGVFPQQWHLKKQQSAVRSSMLMLTSSRRTKSLAAKE